MAPNFWDTSALAKLYLPERGSAWASGKAREGMSVSDLARAEIPSVLRRRYVEGQITQDERDDLFTRFLSDLGGVEVIEITSAVLARAGSLLMQSNAPSLIRSLDAIQLASALEWFARTQSIREHRVFVVADRRLRDAAITLGLPVENPEDHEPDDSYTDAANILPSGGIVALPTDTVYGLCARAGDTAAVERIYDIKQRDPSQAMPVFVASLDQAEQIAVLNDTAIALASAFWPGALTVVVPARDGYDSRALAGGRTIALRAPGDNRIRDLCAAVGPLTGTSANIAGREECHTAAEVRAQLGDKVDLIIDAPVDATGQPSTIVDCTDPASVRILRTGAITPDAIAAALPRGARFAG